LLLLSILVNIKTPQTKSRNVSVLPK